MSIIIEETHSSAPIGVFDSGVGGLTVAREIMRNLPDCQLKTTFTLTIPIP